MIVGVNLSDCFWYQFSSPGLSRIKGRKMIGVVAVGQCQRICMYDFEYF